MRIGSRVAPGVPRCSCGGLPLAALHLGADLEQGQKMQIDLQSDYILVLWEDVPYWAKELYELCVRHIQPLAKEIFPSFLKVNADGKVRVGGTHPRHKNILQDELSDELENSIRCTVADVQDYDSVLDVIKVTGIQLKNYTDKTTIETTHPSLVHITREIGADTQETSVILEAIAETVLRDDFFDKYYCYIEFKDAGPAYCSFPLSCCFLLGKDFSRGTSLTPTIIALSLFPLKAIQYFNSLKIMRSFGDRSDGVFDDLLENIKVADTSCQLADDIDRNNTPADLTDTALAVGGIADNTGPEEGSLLESYQQTVQALIIETVKPLLKYIDNKDEEQKHFKKAASDYKNFSSNKKQGTKIHKCTGYFFSDEGVKYGYYDPAGCWTQLKDHGPIYILTRDNHTDFYERVGEIIKHLPRCKQ